MLFSTQICFRVCLVICVLFDFCVYQFLEMVLATCYIGSLFCLVGEVSGMCICVELNC